MQEGYFKSEKEFRNYLEGIIKESDEDYDYYAHAEILFDHYIINNENGKKIPFFIKDWVFAKNYLKSVKDFCLKPVKPEQSNLEIQLNIDINLRKQVEHDLSIPSIYDDKRRFREEVVNFLHKQYSDPTITVGSAYRFLQDLDSKIFNNKFKDSGLDLIKSLTEKYRDNKMAEHLFYATIARKIFKIYLQDPLIHLE